MSSDMHFNRLQDSVHPVPTIISNGKYQTISFSRKLLICLAAAIVLVFFLAILITHLASKQSNGAKDENLYDGKEGKIASTEKVSTAIMTSTVSSVSDEVLTESTMETERRTALDLEPTTPKQAISTEPTAEELRLPPGLSPISYDLYLKVYLPGYEASIPDGKNFTFEAKISLEMLCTQSKVDRIVLNLNGLTIVSNDFKLKRKNSVDSKELAVLKANVNETLQMVIFELENELDVNETYQFEFDYTGPISSQVLSGMYLSKYMTRDGDMRYLAVTQMEPTDARRMVPCFDEPSMKARWRVTVEHPRGSTALSNGIERSTEAVLATENANEWLVTKFEETLKMSSYLLAIVVCDFHYSEGRTKSGTRFRIWAREAAKKQTEYALKAGIKALEYFEQFYGIGFPLPKQDMIALPDFEAGAMENWGLITYREKYLLYDPQLYSLSEKRRIAVIVAHELAHQWFGNLVTMKWWDDLWLNEGFATFMEFIGSDEISDGQFRMEDYYVIDAFSGALNKDQRSQSHPLFVPIDKTADIYAVFDSISYDKGGTVLRMMDALIGRESFQNGLNIYLNRYKYGNADHIDLWNAMSEAVPDSVLDGNGNRLNLTNFAASWTEQMGYPLIELVRTESGVKLGQKRFKLDNDSLEQEKYRNPVHGYKWNVPIWYEVDGQKQPMKWLQNDDSELEINLDNDQLLVINPEVKGFYRVKYDEQSWRKITHTLQMNHTMIGLKSRAQLIDDAFTLAESGQLPYETAMAVTSYLHNETEYLPWAKAFNSLTRIKYYYEDEAEYGHFQKYMQRLLKPLYNELSWDKLPSAYTNESRAFEDSLQASILAMYCNLGRSDCRHTAAGLFRELFLKPCKSAQLNTSNGSTELMSSQCSKVPLSVRKLVYCKGLILGNDEDWQFVFEMYKKELFQLEKSRLMAALSCTTERWTLNRLLDMTLDGENIRKQDAGKMFYYVSASDVAGPVIWDYFQSHWNKIYDSYKETKSLMKHVVAYCTGFKSEHKVAQFERFIEEHSNETNKFVIFNIQREKAKSNLKWMNKHFLPLTEWLKKENARYEN